MIPNYVKIILLGLILESGEFRSQEPQAAHKKAINFCRMKCQKMLIILIPMPNCEKKPCDWTNIATTSPLCK